MTQPTATDSPNYVTATDNLPKYQPTPRPTLQPSEAYPLNGGVRPNSPAFPAEMNPEIKRLQAELQDKSKELEVVKGILALKDQQLADYKEIILTMLGKSVEKAL